MTNTKIVIVLVSLAAVTAVTGMKLPSYIKRCSRSDPKLEECAVKHANEALPEVVKGDMKHKIPSLSPLVIPEIRLAPGGNLVIALQNCRLYGFENTVVKHVKFDFEKQHCLFKVEINHLNLLADYSVDGSLLILPIRGNGPANFTFIGGDYDYSFDYTLQKRRGKDYLKFGNRTLDYTTQRNYLYLGNLFNGDQILGEQMNRFLDESWKEVSQELYPSLKVTVSEIITSIVSAYFSRIPYEDIFLP